MRPGFDNASLPAPTFQEVLKGLETDSAVCYVLDSTLNITYTNPAWDQFARDNDGSDLTADAVNGNEHLPSDSSHPAPLLHPCIR
jgi:hypothetical protein